MRTEDSARLEQLEGDLARLGSALVYLRLVSERIDAAVSVSRQASLLAPALDDLRQAVRLMRAVQRSLAERPPASPHPAPAQFIECSSKTDHRVHPEPVPVPPGRAGSVKRRPE
ncbi:hypothetical protein SY88_23820 [Clostridiales bacterium PH28_bin88]|nr:hypothetical protein SY88_23820 [Clostridiales bacterium PH28_bin88]